MKAGGTEKSILRGVKGTGLREVYEAAIREGCELSMTRGSHVRVDTPNGPVFGPLTASCRRSAKNLRATLRRYGVGV